MGIESVYRNWYEQKAILQDEMKRANASVQEPLKLLLLQGYAKVASISVEDAKTLGIQTSPLWQESNGYHRDTRHKVKNAVHEAFAKALSLKPTEVHLVHNRNFREVLARQALVCDDFASLEQAVKQEREQVLFLDYSNLQTSVEELKAKLSRFEQKQKIHPIAFTTYLGQTLLLHPQLFEGEEGEKYDSVLFDLIAHSGFTLSPDQLTLAWLKVDTIASILKTYASVTHVEGRAFSIARDVMRDFYALGKSDIPYLNVLAPATAQLVHGLSVENVAAGFQQKGLSDFLHTSYFRLQEAMKRAVKVQNELVPFLNEIGLIHQEIQNQLAIATPYSEGDLSAIVRANLAELLMGFHPPQVALNPSSMHMFATLLSAVEKEKNSKTLNVLLLNDVYFETEAILKEAKHYKVFGLQDERQNQPIDLFVGEFHHNFSKKRGEYSPEKVLDMVQELIKSGSVAKKFTVILDTTLDFEQSWELKAFLDDPLIVQGLKEGSLNVVLHKSLQKFDMLGMDNYYGGLAIAINDPHAFATFNRRFNAAEDSLTGLNYQGIAHLKKYAHQGIENYRKALVNNTKKLYQAIYRKETKSPMKVSTMHDDKLAFLDLKFPHFPKTQTAFISQFRAFAKAEKLPLTCRASFSFANTNLSFISDTSMRLTPGLEKASMLDRYAVFFQQMQKLEGQTDEQVASLVGKNTTDVVT